MSRPSQLPLPMLPVTFRPLGARVVAAVFSFVLVVFVAVLWELLPGEVQAEFTPFQRITLLAVIAAILAGLYAVFRTSARADETGLTVVNGFNRHRYEWRAIVRVSLNRNRPWALLDLDDGTSMAVMALQTADGDYARRRTRRLAHLIEHMSATGEATDG